jgi:hypothetical protein
MSKVLLNLKLPRLNMMNELSQNYSSKFSEYMLPKEVNKICICVELIRIIFRSLPPIGIRVVLAFCFWVGSDPV